MPRFCLPFCLVVALALAGAGVLHAAGRMQFNRDIRPILSDKCFHCHGPDSKKREADLRLDEREVAVESGAIVPRKPEESEVIARILTDDPDDHMPPAKAKLGALSPREIAMLKQWIAEGAEYEAHWSFIPVKPEAVKDQGIDKIVAAGLKERGLTLQAEADAKTLIRRVSFDITGLPPTVEEVRRFLDERDAEGSYAAAVDRLLASPAFGERMAVDWLDIARYADSYGFQVDRERDVWMWRDWVVRAFNSNLPFDQFVTWQLAGDLLPNPTDDQILATAFNRLHQQESEGGSVEEEYRVEYVCDRVQTVATAFLGLTFECARCHDHKFDPITQRDFYGLFAMFQNIDEAGLYSFFTPSPPTPAMMLIDEPTKAKMAALQKTVAELEAKLEKRMTDAVIRELQNAPAKAPALPGELGRFAFDAIDKGKLVNSVPGGKPATLKGENELVEGRDGKAVKFTGDDPVDLAFGNFKRHEPFSVSLWMKTPDVKDRAVVFHRSRAWTDAASRGYELLIEEGKLKWSLIHFWPGNAISIRAKENLPVNQWQHVVVTYDGSSRADGLKIFVNGSRAAIEVIRDGLTRTILGGGGDNIALGERFRDRGFKNGLIDEFRVFDRDISEAASVDGEARQALRKARQELFALQDAQQEIMVMRELAEAKPSFILFRGEYNQRRDPVQPQTPKALGLLPEDGPKNRLALAKWLTSPQHPLFARVTVNRVWQSLWGRGLVRTAEDFGSQGARPVYPKLLDYLAWKFMSSGWDVKALVREIVMSKTYRQRSIADAETMTNDPDNEWLARGPRFRLPAEMIRDNALAAAGLLKVKLGGPPVLPYEMVEGFKPAGPSAGDDVYRRSLYTNWRRTSPPPAMGAFDAPKRSVCIAKRERTDSPLQALVLLNGVQYVEAAKVLGEKLHAEAGGDPAKMIETGFLRCLSRKPDTRELAICRRLYDEQITHFKAKPREAAELLKIGNAKVDAAVPDHEAAAATVLAQALMNHDECVVKR